MNSHYLVLASRLQTFINNYQIAQMLKLKVKS